jgi:catechol 2,3-dioxygenase-like lactoylglutathione lyase family enzyme
MISHVNVGVSDFDRAFAFHSGLMEMLGHRLRFKQDGFAGWEAVGGGRPLFLIARPFDGMPASPGNGQMIAFEAANRALVDLAHAHALAHGGRDEGKPGPRPQYHPNYYGAYFRDPDGNKFCVVCHAAE